MCIGNWPDYWFISGDTDSEYSFLLYLNCPRVRQYRLLCRENHAFMMFVCTSQPSGIGKLPIPNQNLIGIRLGLRLESLQRAVSERICRFTFGRLADRDKQIITLLENQNNQLVMPVTKPKSKDLTEQVKHQNRLVSKFRQSIENVFNWIIEKTNIQKVDKFIRLKLYCSHQVIWTIQPSD